jgi:hypothetical protein
MYVCMYVCMYVYVHTHLHMYIHPRRCVHRHKYTEVILAYGRAEHDDGVSEHLGVLQSVSNLHEQLHVPEINLLGT